MATVSSEVIYDRLTTYWKTANVPRPKIVQRETAEELREVIPNQGLVLVYQELGGIRITPRGNRLYRDETVNVVCDVHTLSSEQHLYQLMEEILRIIEWNTMNVDPFQIARVISYNQKYGRTFRYWTGECRVELNRVGVRTAYTICGARS